MSSLYTMKEDKRGKPCAFLDKVIKEFEGLDSTCQKDTIIPQKIKAALEESLVLLLCYDEEFLEEQHIVQLYDSINKLDEIVLEEKNKYLEPDPSGWEKFVKIVKNVSIGLLAASLFALAVGSLIVSCGCASFLSAGLGIACASLVNATLGGASIAAVIGGSTSAATIATAALALVGFSTVAIAAANKFKNEFINTGRTVLGLFSRPKEKTHEFTPLVESVRKEIEPKVNELPDKTLANVLDLPRPK